MNTFRPQLEALEERCTPTCIGDSCSLEAPLGGHSPVITAVTATTMTLTTPNGHLVAYPPSPITPPNPVRQEALAFLASEGLTPPVPVLPGPVGLFVAAGFISPS